MATFETAFNWTMDFEDPERKYEIVPDAGGQALSGINSAAFPTDFARIAAFAPADRPAAVESFYRLRFWSPWLEQLQSDEVAKRVFDHGFNNNEHNAVKFLQTAAETVSGVSLMVDGLWGPSTLHGANGCDSAALTEAFKTVRKQFYRDLVLKNPDKAKYLNGWLARAGK